MFYIQAVVSDKDIRDVASKAELTHAELRHLYGELELSQADIENQERMADTRDFMLQAEHVLKHWRQKTGKEATKEKLLDTLQECKLNRAKGILEEKWNLTVKGTKRKIY